MENSIEPVHDLSQSTSGAISNSKIVYADSGQSIQAGQGAHSQVHNNYQSNGDLMVDFPHFTRETTVTSCLFSCTPNS